ncbi:MAG: hypothetical protein DME40_09360 [Verrucomicrobia bacterium]|nr:MAG: hypothetical protein DME37_11185 [Verrucomicrobiota bacterium]PYK89962.1 MAG: hypothetical protein DME40_09360 [Verrucomicrobiota bacterium]PYL75930.1 MAG: hypothetical protein DMF27_10540 [Verrucomicrobiota bacterium]
MKSIILISLVAVLCTTAHAQDPVKTSPQYYKVLLENDQVRVLEYRLKAGERGANAFAFGGRGICAQLPTSGPLTSVLQPSRKATAWPADP